MLTIDIRKIHLVLLAAAIAGGVASVVVTLVASASFGSSDLAGAYGSAGVVTGMLVAILVVEILADISGLLYAYRGYRKDDADWYKDFLLLTDVAAVLSLIANFSVSGGATSFLAFVFGVAKIMALGTLAFCKDLGARRTWSVFYALLAVDLLYGLVFATGSGFGLLLSSTMLRLVSTGTIGLSIYGKYQDKARRGTL